MSGLATSVKILPGKWRQAPGRSRARSATDRSRRLRSSMRCDIRVASASTSSGSWLSPVVPGIARTWERLRAGRCPEWIRPASRRLRRRGLRIAGYQVIDTRAVVRRWRTGPARRRRDPGYGWDRRHSVSSCSWVVSMRAMRRALPAHWPTCWATLRQPLGPEHEEPDDEDDRQLPEPDVEHGELTGFLAGGLFLAVLGESASACWFFSCLGSSSSSASDIALRNPFTALPRSVPMELRLLRAEDEHDDEQDDQPVPDAQ